MMLPSGNDAAVTLALYFGGILLPRKQEYDKTHKFNALDEQSVSENEDIDLEVMTTEAEEVKETDLTDFECEAI